MKCYVKTLFEISKTYQISNNFLKTRYHSILNEGKRETERDEDERDGIQQVHRNRPCLYGQLW